MKKRELDKILKEHGFSLMRSGKHNAWSNGEKTVFVAHFHGKDVNGKTTHEILKRAGIK